MSVDTFTTPRGVPVGMEYREGTADWNNLNSGMTEDEYGLRVLHLGGVAIVGGAYVGGVSVALALDNPRLRIVAVEPIPENLALLRSNIERAGVGLQVEVRAGAVGYPGGSQTITYDYAGDDGRIDDFANQHRWYGNTHGYEMYCAGYEHQSVTRQTLAIADLVPHGDIAFVKLDCEGGEYPFLDDPDIIRIERIAGEWHPFDPEGKPRGWRDIVSLLSATHHVQIDTEGDVGGFMAVRR